MLKQRLDEVNAILAKLIALTEEDIENIKVAKHENVTPSVEEKNKLIAEFITAKKQLDVALVELNNSSTKGLSELLDDEDKQKQARGQKFLRMRRKLRKLCRIAPLPSAKERSQIR